MSSQVIVICLTQTGREGLVQRAIDSFLDQRTSSGQLLDAQLLVVISDMVLFKLLDRECYHSCKVFPILRLGLSPELMLRAAIQTLHDFEPPETLVTLWDDDDVSHPLRLATQIDAARVGGAGWLTAGFWHFYDSREIFVVEQEVRHQPLVTRVIPNTVMLPLKSLQPDDCSWNGKGSLTANLGRRLLPRYPDAARLDGQFGLIKVGVRGDNASGYEAQRSLATGIKSATRAWLQARRNIVEHWLDGYAFDPGLVDVCGRDGIAFAYTPGRVPARMPEIGKPTGIEQVLESTGDASV